jgi:hypothetical protein
MSMEICVLSDAQLNSMSEWQHVIDAEGFLLRLSSRRPFPELAGFLPSHLRDERTGFECHHVPAKEMIETYADIDFKHKWKYALVFVWGGNNRAMKAAWMAATAYARATAGIVFDPQAGQLFSAAEALEVVKDNERVMPE